MTLEEIKKKQVALTELRKICDGIEKEIKDANVDGFYRTTLYVQIHELNGDSGGAIFIVNALATKEVKKSLTYDLEKPNERIELQRLIEKSEIGFIDDNSRSFLLDIIAKAEIEYPQSFLKDEELIEIGKNITKKLEDLNIGCNGYGIGKQNTVHIYLLKDINKQLKREIIGCMGDGAIIEFKVSGEAVLL
jgi:hypothetical protein